MDQRSIAAARYQLQRAKEAASILQNQPVPRSMAEQAWIDFLSASSLIFGKLYEGARRSKSAAPWAGRVKHFRKTDELLRYLHHARDAEEHGLDPSIKIAPPQDLSAKLIHVDGKPHIQVTFKPPRHLSLVDVVDSRTGDVFRLPTKHRGKPLSSMSVGDMCALALVYLTELVDEAAAMPPSSQA